MCRSIRARGEPYIVLTLEKESPNAEIRSYGRFCRNKWLSSVSSSVDHHVRDEKCETEALRRGETEVQLGKIMAMSWPLGQHSPRRATMSAVDEAISNEAICEAFLEHLEEKNLDGMSYGDFWRVLHARGLRARGRSAKNERDSVYRALSSDSRIVKAKPGFFVRSAGS